MFVLNGFDHDADIKENLTTLGGIIAPNNYKGIPDFGIVPLQGASLRFTVNEIVTNYFIVSTVNDFERPHSRRIFLSGRLYPTKQIVRYYVLP